MRLLQLVVAIACLLWVVGCETIVRPPPAHSKKRITYYHRFEDRFGSRTAIGVRAKEGVTIAAPRSVAFGQRYFIPDLAGKIGTGHFIVQDRGRCVKGDRIDIYIEAATRLQAKKRMRQLMCLQPYLEVEEE